MNTEQYLNNTTGKQLQYVDNINYTDSIASEIKECEPKLNISLEEVLAEFGFNETITGELTARLTEFLEDEIRISCIEFVKRLTQQMNQSKYGYCWLRAVGISVDGMSLKQASKKYFCSAQYLHKLSNLIAESCDIEPIASLNVIRKYSRNMRVRAEDSNFYTMTEAQKYLKVNNRKLKKLIDDNNITTKGWIRNSKLIHQEELDKLEIIIDEKK